MGGLVLYEEGCVMNNTFTGHNTFIFLFPTRPRAFFLALICSGCHGLGWTDPRVYHFSPFRRAPSACSLLLLLDHRDEKSIVPLAARHIDGVPPTAEDLGENDP